ncbi:MAG: hypothetical protein KG075_23755 [Alphaproteobacteria bacterium]|nr:hypothetical protein [Alphaproteobacteria bacterium]
MKTRFKKTVAAAAVTLAVVTVSVLPVSQAHAGADTTLQPIENWVENVVSGSGGRTAAGVALLSAVVGSALKFNPWQFAGAVGVGIAAGAGWEIVTAGATAEI